MRAGAAFKFLQRLLPIHRGGMQQPPLNRSAYLRGKQADLGTAGEWAAHRCHPDATLFGRTGAPLPNGVMAVSDS